MINLYNDKKRRGTPHNSCGNEMHIPHPLHSQKHYDGVTLVQYQSVPFQQREAAQFARSETNVKCRSYNGPVGIKWNLRRLQSYQIKTNHVLGLFEGVICRILAYFE